MEIVENLIVIREESIIIRIRQCLMAISHKIQVTSMTKEAHQGFSRSARHDSSAQVLKSPPFLILDVIMTQEFLCNV